MQTEHFTLTKEQVSFLNNEYSENELIKAVLDTEINGVFRLDEDTEIMLMDYLDDESVYWMNAQQETTPKTYMIESIRDSIYYQLYPNG